MTGQFLGPSACLNVPRTADLQQRPPPTTTTTTGKPDMPGREPVAYPFAPCVHFELVNLCRLDQDVPWMKA
jgi:hypothetical protein